MSPYGSPPCLHPRQPHPGGQQDQAAPQDPAPRHDPSDQSAPSRPVGNENGSHSLWTVVPLWTTTGDPHSLSPPPPQYTVPTQCPLTHRDAFLASCSRGTLWAWAPRRTNGSPGSCCASFPRGALREATESGPRKKAQHPYSRAPLAVTPSRTEDSGTFQLTLASLCPEHGPSQELLLRLPSHSLPP